MSYLRTDPNPNLTMAERIDLLELSYWDNTQIMDYTGLKMHAVIELKKQVKAKYPTALNPFNNRWISSDLVIKQFYSETKAEHAAKIVEAYNLRKQLGLIKESENNNELRPS